MKKFATTLVIALGVAAPSIASAMTAGQSVHSDEARVIFEKLAEEARGDRS